MGSGDRYIIPVIQIIAGVLLTVFTYGTAAEIGVSLIISGAVGLVAGFLTADSGGDFTTSPTYRAGIVSNHRGEGEFIAVNLGENLLTPLAISTHINSLTFSDQLRRIYLLGHKMKVYNANEDDADDLSDLRQRVTIDDVPIDTIDPNAVIKIVHTDATNKGKIPGFLRIGRPYPQGNVTLQWQEQFVYSMKEASEGIHMVIDWPQGIWRQKDSGSIVAAHTGLKFEYRVISEISDGGQDDDWVTMNLGDAVIKENKVQYGQRIPQPVIIWEAAKENAQWVSNAFPLTPKDYGVDGVYFVIGQSQAHIRAVARWRFPAGKDKYQIRLTGWGLDASDRSVLPVINTFIETDFDSAATDIEDVTLMAVLFTTNAQFKNREPIVKIQALGSEMEQVENGSGGVYPTGISSNPASHVREFLINDVWGLGQWVKAANIDNTTFESMATDCEASVKYARDGEAATLTRKLHTSNLVIDIQAVSRDWINQLLLPARGSLYTAEGKFFVFRDKSRASIRTFEERIGQTGARYNIIAGPDGKSQLQPEDIPEEQLYNRVLLRYPDAEERYKQKTVESKESAAVGDTVPDVTLEIFAPAITNADEAIEMANFLLNRALFSKQICKIPVGPGDLDVLPGDRITVKADWPQWPSDTRDWLVLGADITMLGTGVILGREYSETVFTNIPVAPSVPAGGSLTSINDIKSSQEKIEKIETPDGWGYRTPWFSVIYSQGASQVKASTEDSA